MAGYKFSKDAAERTKRAVIGFERQYADMGGGNPRSGHGRGDDGFYAKITAGGSGGVDDYKYSWEKVEFLDTGLWQSKTEWGTGSRTQNTGYGVEFKYRSSYVPNGSIVWMWPAPGRDFYLFEYNSESRWAKLASDITAMSGSTYGEGTVRLERQIVANTENDNYHTQNMKVYNPGPDPIDLPTESGEVARVMIHMVQGRWHILWSECDT